MTIKLNINGKDVDVDAAEGTPLLWVLRDHLGPVSYTHLTLPTILLV